MSQSTASENTILVRFQMTPNPRAFKTIVNAPLKMSGNASFKLADKEYCQLPLVVELLSLSGVENLYIFENCATLTFDDPAEFSKNKKNIESIFKTRMTVHDPNFKTKEEIEKSDSVQIEKARRNSLTPELEQIENILDRTVRPGLQADGGDIEIVEYHNNELIIAYKGACGSCPSSTMGTLQAIQGILQDEFNPDIVVTPQIEDDFDF